MKKILKVLGITIALITVGAVTRANFKKSEPVTANGQKFSSVNNRYPEHQKVRHMTQ